MCPLYTFTAFVNKNIDLVISQEVYQAGALQKKQILFKSLRWITQFNIINPVSWHTNNTNLKNHGRSLKSCSLIGWAVATALRGMASGELWLVEKVRVIWKTMGYLGSQGCWQVLNSVTDCLLWKNKNKNRIEDGCQSWISEVMTLQFTAATLSYNLFLIRL